MEQRKRLKSAEIEALCVKALKTQNGLRQVSYANIRPYKGGKSWTWELYDAGPGAGPLALNDAKLAVIAKFQGEYDLIE
jgi:hypothetical protein